MQAPWSDEAGGLRVAIDIGMESLMSDGELASLATQVMLSYAFVLKHCVAQNWRPLRLALTNTDAAAATLARIRDAASAEIGDAWPVKVVGSDFATGLPALCAPSDAPQIVVLSPDADTPLTTLDPGSIYVVGGLCDYRRIANATRDRARERGDGVCRRRISRSRPLGKKRRLAHQTAGGDFDGRPGGSDFAPLLQHWAIGWALSSRRPSRRVKPCAP